MSISYFDGSLDNDRNNYFALNENQVLEVSKVPYNEEIPDPRDKSTSVFITFEDGFGDPEPSPDNSPFESLGEMCEHFGVPEEIAYPGINSESAETDLSYVELAEAYEKMPSEIVKYAERKGVTMMAVYGDLEEGFTSDDTAGKPFAGFIYSDDGRMDYNDLEKDIQDYNAYLQHDVYETKIYDLDFDKNEVSTIANDDIYPEAVGTFYGYEADMNGLADVVDFGNYLGAYKNIGELNLAMSAMDISADFEDKTRPVEVNSFEGFKSSDLWIEGTMAFMQDPDHVIMVTHDIDTDPATYRESMSDAFLVFDGTEVASDSPDKMDLNIHELADHFGISASRVDEIMENAEDATTGVSDVIDEIVKAGRDRDISVVPVRVYGEGPGAEFITNDRPQPFNGNDRIGLIYDEKTDCGIESELANEVDTYSALLRNELYDFEVYAIVDDQIDFDNGPEEAGEITSNSDFRARVDLDLYMGVKERPIDFHIDIPSSDLAKMRDFTAKKQGLSVVKDAIAKHNEKPDREAQKNRDKDQNDPDMK